MVLDELREGDFEINQDGLSFVVEEGITDIYNKFTIDYRKGLFGNRFIVSINGFA